MKKVQYHIIELEKGGKKRPITVYAPQEMAAQRALLKRVECDLAKKVHACAYGYVQGRSPWTVAKNAIEASKAYSGYLKCDIKSFFSSINRERLRKLLTGCVSPDAADQILRYAICCREGIAQGSPLSPVLSNLYLYDFDEKMAKLPNSRYFRYADDILIFANDPREALKSVSRALQEKGLGLADEKTIIGNPTKGFSFLGLDFKDGKLHISAGKLREFTIKMEKASEKERQQIYKGFEAYYREAQYLHPDAGMLFWMLRYGDPNRVANYIRQFPDAEWAKVQGICHNGV